MLDGQWFVPQETRHRDVAIALQPSRHTTAVPGTRLRLSSGGVFEGHATIVNHTKLGTIGVVSGGWMIGGVELREAHALPHHLASSRQPLHHAP